MEFGILGPLVVWRDGGEVSIGSAKQRAALAVLLLRRGEVVPVATLVDLLWGERQPARAVDALRVHVSQLRKLVDSGIETRPAGYVLRVAPDALDAERFERSVTAARTHLVRHEPREAAAEALRALELWRGPPLVEFRDEAFAREEIARLEELRLAALECRFEAELALGHHLEVVPEIEALVRDHPLRENLRRLQMLALYRAGRQADALAAFQDARRLLTAELGLEPGEPLRRLERDILRHDPGLELVDDPRQPAEAPPSRIGRRGRTFAVLLGSLGVAAAISVTLLVSGGGSANRPGAAADAVAIIDPTTDRATRTIPLGVAPDAIAIGAGSLWVVGTDSGTVSRIDPEKGTAVQTFHVGNGPNGIAFAAGQVWVVNGLDGTVTRIDPETDTIVQRAIPVGNIPSGIAAGFGRVWVANSADGTVTPINEHTGRPARPIPVAQGANGIATGAGAVWVTTSAGGGVTRIDPRTGATIGYVTTGAGANAVTVAFGSVWVANGLDSTVARVDPGTLTVRAVLPTGDGPDGIAAARNAIWTTDQFAGTLTRIDAASNASGSHTVEMGGRPNGIVAGQRGLAVATLSSDGGHRGGTLRVLAAMYRFPLDPAVVGGVLPSEVATLTNDGLTAFRKVGGSTGTELVPDLAVSLPEATDGGRSYSFRLRPGLRYSNGAPVRPRDIRWAIERSIRLDNGQWSAPYYAGIVGAESCIAAPQRACDLSHGIVIGPRSDTVTFHLVEPDPDFLFKLALPAAFAVPAGTPLHPRGFVPATGAYELASVSLGRAIRLVRNPRFREWSPAAQPAGFPNVIEIRSYGQGRAAASAALAGRVDLAMFYSAPQSLLFDLMTQHPGQLSVNPWDNTYNLVLNTRRRPFEDVRVRRALNFAIDRRRLRNLTLGPGLGRLTCQILPPDFPGYRPFCPYTANPTSDGAWHAPDLARARRLVRASHAAGEAVTVWMPPWLRFGARAAAYVVSVLDDLGFRAHSRIVRGANARDPFTVEDRIGLQIGFNGWYPDYASPSGDILGGLTCSSYKRDNAGNENLAEFCDPAIDRDIARAQSLQHPDPEAASSLWRRIDTEITDQAPWVSFANGVVVDVKSRRLGNYEYSPQWGVLLDQLWVR